MIDAPDSGEQPRCERCGTVMRDIAGGYECAWDATTIDIPRTDRPGSGDQMPGIGGY